MQWATFRGQCPPDISRAWAYMHPDGLMAAGSVFEMKDGRFKVVYSILGQVVPTVDGPFLSLGDAKKHMEFSVSHKVLRSRPVLLDAGFF